MFENLRASFAVVIKLNLVDVLLLLGPLGASAHFRKSDVWRQDGDNEDWGLFSPPGFNCQSAPSESNSFWDFSTPFGEVHKGEPKWGAEQTCIDNVIDCGTHCHKNQVISSFGGWGAGESVITSNSQ